MLKVDHIAVAYGRVRVLFDLSLMAKPGTIHCLLGRNGAGKTTTLKAIMGLLPLQNGTIHLDDDEISALAAHDIPQHRISLVPQGRRLFADLTVDENLQIGMMARKAGSRGRDYGLTLFPPLATRLKQIAGTLSGGEQQMLAIARSLCVEPRVLMLDEPTEGLQPSMIDQIHGAIRNLRADGVAILLVEQHSDAILDLADTATFLENGRDAETLGREALRASPETLQRYLGI